MQSRSLRFYALRKSNSSLQVCTLLILERLRLTTPWPVMLRAMCSYYALKGGATPTKPSPRSQAFRFCPPIWALFSFTCFLILATNLCAIIQLRVTHGCTLATSPPDRLVASSARPSVPATLHV